MAAKRREIGEVETRVPLVSDADASVEAEVDWGTAQVIMRGEQQKVRYAYTSLRSRTGR